MIQIQTVNDNQRTTITPSYTLESILVPGAETNLGYLFMDNFITNPYGIPMGTSSTITLTMMASMMMGRLPNTFNWGSILLRNSKTKQSMTLLDYYTLGTQHESIIGIADMEAPVTSDDVIAGTLNAAESTNPDIHTSKRVLKRTFDFIKGHAVGTFDEICIMPCPFLSGTNYPNDRGGVAKYSSVLSSDISGRVMIEPKVSLYTNTSSTWIRHAVDPQGRLLAVYRGDGVGTTGSGQNQYSYNDGTRYARLMIPGFVNTGHQTVVYMDGSFILLGNSNVTSVSGYNSTTAAKFYRLGEITYNEEADCFETTVEEGTFPLPDTKGAYYYPAAGWTVDNRNYVFFQTTASTSSGVGLVMELGAGLTTQVNTGVWGETIYSSGTVRDYPFNMIWDEASKSMYIMRSSYALKVGMDCTVTPLGATRYYFNQGAYGSFSKYPHNPDFWNVQYGPRFLSSANAGYYHIGKVLPITEPLMTIKLAQPIENTGEETMTIALTFDLLCM